MKKYIVLITLAFCTPLLGQINSNGLWRCNTTTSNANVRSYTKIGNVDNERVGKYKKLINLHLHILRTDDGKQGFSEFEVKKWIDIVRNDYKPHKIIFNIVKITSINSTYYYNDMNDYKFGNLIKTNHSSNALNIYFLSPKESYSRAEDIPSTALVIGGIYKNTSVLSHEIGHCFGLFHTHSGSGCFDFANCRDDNKCSSCGDYVCDTPVDPCLSENVNNNCQYVGDRRYNPDTRNIMSYSNPNCLSRLSDGQAHRIHYFLERDANIKRIIGVFPSLETDAMPWGFCKKTRFYIKDLPDGSTVNWKRSGFSSSVVDGKNPSEIVIDFGKEYPARVEAEVTTPCGEKHHLSIASMNNAYIRNEYVHLKITDYVNNSSGRYYKAVLNLDEWQELNHYQARRFTIENTHHCLVDKPHDFNEIKIYPQGNNPSVTFSIGTEDTCEPELATFVIDTSFPIKFPYIIPTQESQNKHFLPPLTEIENCNTPQLLKGQIYTYKRAGARKIYIDFAQDLTFTQDPNNPYKHWDFSKETPNIANDFPNGYFECIPEDNSISYMHPLKISATSGEIFYNSPRYVGIGDWGNVWVRFVTDCYASNWQLMDFENYYHTNGYDVDKNDGYSSPILFRMSPNPARNDVQLWLETQTNNEFSLRTSAEVPQAKSSQNTGYQVQIYNLAGVLVRDYQGKTSKAKISVEGLPTGVYFVHFTQNGQTYKGKLIIE